MLENHIRMNIDGLRSVSIFKVALIFPMSSTCFERSNPVNLNDLCLMHILLDICRFLVIGRMLIKVSWIGVIGVVAIRIGFWVVVVMGLFFEEVNHFLPLSFDLIDFNVSELLWLFLTYSTAIGPHLLKLLI